MANTQTISAKEDDWEDDYDDDYENDNDEDDKSMTMQMVILRLAAFLKGRKSKCLVEICQICVTLNLINGREDTFEGKIKLSFMKVRKMASEFEFCFI